MEIAPHVHRIGNDIVAAYLVDTDEGVTVIDAKHDIAILRDSTDARPDGAPDLQLG